MSKIEFKNGSTIECLESNSNSRRHRSTLISFYCSQCQTVHEDYPISNIMFIGENYEMCKDSYEHVLEPYMNKLSKQMLD